MNEANSPAATWNRVPTKVVRSIFSVLVIAACAIFVPAMYGVNASPVTVVVVLFCGSMLIREGWHVPTTRIWKLFGASAVGFIAGFGLTRLWMGWEFAGGRGIAGACIAMLFLMPPQRMISPT